MNTLFRRPAVGLIALLVLGFGGTAGQADILRSGAAKANASRNAAARERAGAEAAALAQQVHQDRLARTTQALTAMKNFQAAARAAALNGADNLGINPNDPTQTLPNVINGLGPNGLQVDLLNPRWEGAEAPTQSQSGEQTTVTIRQTAQQAILHWSKFNVGKKTTVNFDQRAGGTDAGKWVAFNRITDPTGQPSQILGNINAQGQVYLINQNGIIFGGTSQVNARGLVASSLSLNMEQVERGILNQETGNVRFLLDASLRDMTVNGGKVGDVTVRAGAILKAPTNESKSGGRIILAAPNVTNHGSISTPDGQTILAAGLQVGLTAHSSDDPSLRGLDVFVGRVSGLSDSNGVAVETVASTAGTVTQRGLIQASRGHIGLAGRAITHAGFLDSSTSVSLNGRVDFLALYNAVVNPQFGNGSTVAFVPTETGTVRVEGGAVVRILPEWASTEKAVGTELALPSQINLQGRNIYFGVNSILQAPNAVVDVRAGIFDTTITSSSAQSTLVYNQGQIYLDSGALIDVAGSTNVILSLTQNILELALRGAELARSPLQRASILRGLGLSIDLRRNGTYAGWQWVGTPLGDISGYAGLIQRGVGELTVDGGKVNLRAGDSVVTRGGSVIDVSGGWIDWQGANIITSRVRSGSQILDISEALPDRIYDGLFSAMWTRTNAKYGISQTFRIPLVYTGERYEPGYISGGDAGAILIQAPGMALDGRLSARVVEGERQLRSSVATSDLPQGGTLELRFVGERRNAGKLLYLEASPTPPQITFADGTYLPEPGEFEVDGDDNAPLLSAVRLGSVILSPKELEEEGFQVVKVENAEGQILVKEGATIRLRPYGTLELNGAAVDIRGSIVIPGGTVRLQGNNSSPYAFAQENLAALPALDPTKGLVRIAPGARIDVSGLWVDDRPGSATAGSSPIILDGGEIVLEALRVRLEEGSALNASGGMLAFVNNGRTSLTSGSLLYGNGGSIGLLAGLDPAVAGQIGGELVLRGSYVAYGGLGKEGGELRLRAQQVQIGGGNPGGGLLHLTEEFFQRGGFSTFEISGVGKEETPGSGVFSTALLIAPGTRLAVNHQSLVAIPFLRTGKLGAQLVVAPDGSRTPTRFAFEATGATDSFTGLQVARGSVVLGAGAEILAGPRGVVGFKGQTVDILGGVYAPGGQIAVSGATKTTTAFPNAVDPLVTVYLGPGSILSTAGATLVLPDGFGRRRGVVLPGGSITVQGNVAAVAGAVLDVSGTRGVLDLTWAERGGLLSELWSGSGLNRPLISIQGIPTWLESDAGSITLKGGEFLYTSASLLGFAGGKSALGGSLTIASGRFSADGNRADNEINLTVREGQALLTAGLVGGTGAALNVGGVSPRGGYVTVGDFRSGGFELWDLQGNVEFRGPVDLVAARGLRIATGGVIWADSRVSLKAPYVALGQSFADPLAEGETARLFQEVLAGTASELFFEPTYGTGSVVVQANLIDLGTTSFQNIGSVQLFAPNGDVRGSGTVNVRGILEIQAGQIYPTTATSLNLIVYDPNTAGGEFGSIIIRGGAERPLPFSAGGELNLYATRIEQRGVLRAPFGSITLGYDGTGDAPVDPITGNKLAFPVTSSLVLGSGSETSVSGRGLFLPYGITEDGSSWIDPHGVDITSSGLKEKSIRLAGAEVTTEKGSLVDLRGGGDLFAYRFVSGNGGPTDVLEGSGVFAVLPGYGFDYAPYSPFNSATGDAGFVNNRLKVGDRVYLSGGGGLAAGYYTLLPARYALLPGAFLVTPSGSAPLKAITRLDGSSLVGGFQDNGSKAGRVPVVVWKGFEVAPAAVVRERAEYEVLGADMFLRLRASQLGVERQDLPMDSGGLVFQARTSLTLSGSVAASSGFGGRGARIDLSTPTDIWIGTTSVGVPAGTTFLDSSVLSSWKADSLLIGGSRTRSTDGYFVEASSGRVTVANAGSVLQGPEILLVAREALIFNAGSSIIAKGSATSSLIEVEGDGALARVSSAEVAAPGRGGGSESAVAHLRVGAGVTMGGTSIVLDSAAGFSVDPSAEVLSRSISLRAGRISLELDNPGSLQPNAGLVIEGDFRTALENAGILELLSYSSIDFYGSGSFGGDLERLTLGARQWRGFNTGGGTVLIEADTIELQNPTATILSAASAAPEGGLELRARIIEFGDGEVAFDQFTGTRLAASEQILAGGSGNFTFGGDLLVLSPLVSGANMVDLGISATGAMDWLGGSADASVTGSGLGAVLRLEAGSMNLDTAFVLPSGYLQARALVGDVVVGASGLLDLAGTEQHFYDVVRYTDGGIVDLQSDLGSVKLLAGSRVSVAAMDEGGSAGSVAIYNPKGNFVADGSLLGTAAAGEQSGSFMLDTGVLADFEWLSGVLDVGGFAESRSLRIRQGDVVIDHLIKSHSFSLSADGGSITVASGGKVDASGSTGGDISLWASGSLTLEAGSVLSVAAEHFDSAAKGGSVTLGAGGGVDGDADLTAWLDIQAGSEVDLRVGDYVAGDYLTVGSSAFLGRFEGTLHLRAPQTADYSDVLVGALDGDILGGSSILVEGFRIYDLGDYGGFLNTYWRDRMKEDGEAFLGVAGEDNAGTKDAAIRDRLTVGNAGIRDRLVLAPGFEFINTAEAADATFSLQTVGATLVVPSTGGSVFFPNGTVGASRIRSSATGIITSATGEETVLARNTNVVLAPGSTVTLAIGGTLTYAGSSAGTITATLASGQAFETGASGGSVYLADRGATLTLVNSSTSMASLVAGTRVTLPSGTIGTQRLVSTSNGVITMPDGSTQVLAANTATIIPAGASVTLTSAGNLYFTGGASGEGMVLALASGEMTSVGGVGILPATGGLRLGQPNQTGSTSSEALAVADWDLSGFRFGEQRAPGVLTLRAGGNLVFNNALSDGFVPIMTTGNAAFANAGNSYLWLATLQTIVDTLPVNTQSWSYRLVAGADLAAGNPLAVRRTVDLEEDGIGNLWVGEFYAAVPNSTSTGTGAGVGRDGQTADSIRINSAAVTSSVTDLGTRYEVIRTGTGSIEVSVANDVWLRNQFSTIYTAGVAVPDASRIFQNGDFSVPINIGSGVNPDQGTLGIAQQNYPAQYAMAGGNLGISAGRDIARVTFYRGEIIPDSSYQIPTNWLYRRGYVNASGVFGTTQVGALVDSSASTTWWVDYSNFFQGFGALGGGHVTLEAGRDVVNADAALPTNARMVGLDGAGNAVAPKADLLLEYGGGDLTVKAGRNVDGGTYYVEYGKGAISAVGQITTNAARSPSLGILAGATPSIMDSSTWQALTLFGGRTQFEVQAKGDVLLGPVGSAFLLPQGLSNKFWYKTQFNTISEEAGVSVSSLGGDVIHRLSVTSSSDASPTPVLAFLTGQYSALSSLSIGYYQPWVRLAEPNIGYFSTLFTVALPSLESVSFSGDIRIAGTMNLAPSPKADLNLLARGSILGLQAVGKGARSGVSGSVWTAGRINLSDANPANMRTITTPLAYQQLVGGVLANLLAVPNAQNPVASISALFEETGSFSGAAASISRKQNLHASGLLQRSNPDPVRIYAAGGDISGLTLYSGKFSRVVAWQDITDIAFYLQNSRDLDHSVVSAGRDIIAYNANSALRTQVNSAGNLLANQEGPLAGDIQIAGPGSLQVLAGRHLDLGTGGQNANGTGAGIVSIGNARNPFLPTAGANLIVGAGLGRAAVSLFASSLAIVDFLRNQGATGSYLAELGVSNVESLPEEEQARVALGVFYLMLRDAGRAAAGADSPLSGYADGFRAIEELFGGTRSVGNLLLRSRDVRTKSGGDIQMFAPGGGLEMASTQGTGSSLIPPGVVTESGGSVRIFTHNSVSIGIGRIFTLRGGDIVIWSSTGDIAAGSSSKTVQSAPPTRVLIDPQSGLVETDLAGLATGGGIGVLATVAGVAPGNVDLIAPEGVVDAGDAGIQSSGNLIIAATAVVNAGNISAGGAAGGAASAPAPAAAAAPAVSAPTSPTAANNQAAESMASQSAAQAEESEAAPSVYAVEVLGYGGSEEEDEDRLSAGGAAEPSA